ncbi:CDP-alcohol phosphatidyltransferase family protein [Nesterenkonia flava]|uniref:CDP-alcohol phosphatidyltransferase family protein n=1 Tax=Nesterenkonia flava TaxID=469799 RepID=A0ABU1FR15_9MICC|nr:CDP-alcohol phosphatidyltransferase family protein [Nesterenkonia flava]MDR5711096.1 CDP-alcohol phosphatidyltransferase family protein [Nesterenkonia flava]
MRLIGAGTREGFEYTVKTTFWTVPNVITILRFLLVPVFVWFVSEGSYWEAFWVLVVLGATDWIDGFVARFFNQLSTVGRWLDPLADRLAMVIVTAALVYFEVAPSWLLWLILLPDFLLFLNSAVLFAGSPQLPVSGMGKIRTACLMVALPLLLLAQLEDFAELLAGLFPLVAESLLIAGGIMHVIASLDYFFQAHAKFRRLRTQGINPWDRKRWAQPALENA